MVVAGTRVPVDVVIENLADGLTVAEIVDSYPTLTTDDVGLVLEEPEAALIARGPVPAREPTEPGAPSPASLYEADIYAWSQTQARLLCDLAASLADAGGSLPAGLDPENITEEIESVGRMQRADAASALVEALMRLIRVAVTPEDELSRPRLEQAVTRLQDAADAVSPPMRLAIRLGRVWATACQEARGNMADADMDVRGLLQPPAARPFTLDELVSGEPDARGLMAKLQAALRA